MKKAFTLIELLVVIAIIAILAAILFPVFAQAKSAAKRTAELSNVKNINLGIIMYSTDYDDTLVLVYQANWSHPRDQIVLWKDSILPYIKNGGLPPKPDGTVYTAQQQGGAGGVFAAPTYDGNWAPYNDGSQTYDGDTSSRFPRAFALNCDAGKNENLGDSDINSEDATIWSRAYTWDGYPIYVQGGGGNVNALDNVAGTAMTMGTRTPYPNIYSRYFAYQCDANWCGYPSDTSYARGVGTKLVTLSFFDGHVKTMNAFRSFADDVYDMYKVRCTSTNWPCAPAVTYWMTQIGEWK